jgi:DNA-directed RNA polymerase specialized sigma24 family protein
MASGTEYWKFYPEDWDKTLGKMSTTPAKVGNSPIELLMAGPGDEQDESLNLDIREAVTEGMAKLPDKYRFVLEAKYIWGHSYYEIAKMMGYSSKASAYDIIKSAEKKLGVILRDDERIKKLLEANGELE